MHTSLPISNLVQLGVAFMNKEVILVAEDSPANRRILVHLLQKMGFETLEFEDGEEAWNEIKNGIEGLVAIVSDIMMPKMDGVELLEKVRASSENKTLPFFLCTAVMDKEYILKSRSLGVSSYIVKPITFDKLEKKLKTTFPERKWPIAI